ncbi:hypothetical protein KQH82_06725 [bacterium]|nr:hypothetical protein [bacterium]
MIRLISVCSLLVVMFFPVSAAWAQNDSGIDTEALIDRILAVYSEQRDALTTVTFDVVLSEGEMKDKEGFVEKERFDKKVYLKFQPDTIWFHEEYLAYYKDGEQKSEKDLRNAEKDRRKKKESRKSFDISYPMVKPFQAENRSLYDITYEGTTEEPDGRYLCHVFSVKAKVDADTLLNGTWYFDSETFQLAHVDFSPARLVKKTMFKLNELDMSLVQGPNPDGYWLPERFEIVGKGKAAFFVGVSFAGQAYYRNPIINSPVPDSLFFEEEDND